jgi:hypothetical protein
VDRSAGRAVGLVQRVRSTPAPPAPQEPTRLADPGQVAVAAGIATRAPDNSVVFSPPPGAVQVARQAADPAPAGALLPAAPAPAAGAGGQDRMAPDLAEMADELYERIELRLRSDLLLERERRGSLPDL